MTEQKIFLATKEEQDRLSSEVNNLTEQSNSHNNDKVKHITATERTMWNNSEKNAKEYTDSLPEAMLLNTGKFNIERTNKASTGVFTLIKYYRLDGTLFAESYLHGNSGPNYPTRTLIYYAADGSTELKRDVWTLTYDTDGNVTKEVKS